MCRKSVLILIEMQQEPILELNQWALEMIIADYSSATLSVDVVGKITEYEHVYSIHIQFEK